MTRTHIRKAKAEPDPVVRGAGRAAKRREKKASPNPVTLTRASDILPSNTDWAWKGGIPVGAVSLVVGPAGLGKSTTIYDRVAQLTRGTLEGDLHGTPVTVLIATECRGDPAPHGSRRRPRPGLHRHPHPR